MLGCQKTDQGIDYVLIYGDPMQEIDQLDDLENFMIATRFW